MFQLPNPELGGGYAIVGDLHGHADLLKQAADIIDPAKTTFAVQDMFDKGPEIRECLLFAKEIGAISLADNHSWVMGNALLPEETGDEDWIRRYWLTGWHRWIEDRTLESFGLVKTSDQARDIAALRSKLEEDGLIPFVYGQPYLEPVDSDFIAIHAGLSFDPWEVQKRYLDKFTDIKERSRCVPVQIFDDEFALSRSKHIIPEVTDKKVITGHDHLRGPVAARVSAGGRRIRLASELVLGDSLFIYLTQTGEIVEIPQKKDSMINA